MRRIIGKTIALRPRPVWCVFVLAVFLAGQAAPAATGDIPRARRLLLTGKYGEAAELFRKSLGAADTASAAVGLARCLASEGKTDEAARVLAGAVEKTKDAGREKARLLAELARLAFDNGDYTAAERHAEAAIGLDGNNPLARLLRAELFRTSGRLVEAKTSYEWLVKFHNNEENDTFGSADSLRVIGLAAGRLAEWNRNAEDFKFLVDEIYPAAVKLDRQYWPARYEMGRLFLEKFNRADASREFSAALAVNPNAAEVHAAVARLALLERDVKKAQTSAGRAIEINPRLTAAWLVKADLLWANFDVEGARRLLAEKALPLNPRNEATLGRMAACYFMLDSPGDSPRPESRLDRLIAEVESHNPPRRPISISSWANGSTTGIASKRPAAIIPKRKS